MKINEKFIEGIFNKKEKVKFHNYPFEMIKPMA